MPVFDFRCTECGERTEHILLSGEAAPTSCPSCGGAVKRAWGGARIHVNLEGWGFSKTDALISDARSPRKDFKKLRERAQRIVEE